MLAAHTPRYSAMFTRLSAMPLAGLAALLFLLHHPGQAAAAGKVKWQGTPTRAPAAKAFCLGASRVRRARERPTAHSALGAVCERLRSGC